VTTTIRVPATPSPTRRNRLSRVTTVVCLAISALGMTAVVLVAVVHLSDRYAIDPASGARIALARYVASGVLYPPLVGEDGFGGTRFMPLPVLLHAALSRVTGEFLLSGKLLALATMLGVALLTLAVIRRRGCPLSLSIGLVAVVLTTSTGLLAVTGLRGDSLPLLLQLLALAVASSSTSTRSTWLSAALAALAVTAKLHAVWAAVAIVVWLAVTDRRRLVHFVGAYVGITAGLLGILTVITDGRILENVLGLSGAGLTGPAGLLTSPYRLLQLLVTDALGTWVLLPVAVVIVGLALLRRSVDPWQLSLVAALGVTVVVLADIGTGPNQLIDLAVLSAIVVAQAIGAGGHAAWSRTAMEAAVVWLVLTGLAVTVAPAARDAAVTLHGDGRYRSDPLAGVADARTKVLSEDPYVPVSLGQDPVVLDPFMLPRIGAHDPGAVRRLVDRIDAQDFELVVLVESLDNEEWWADYHFGTDVIAAVDRAYVRTERVQGYDVYRPRPAP
jgi:hypothetical protein